MLRMRIMSRVASNDTRSVAAPSEQPFVVVVVGAVAPPTHVTVAGGCVTVVASPRVYAALP